MYAVRLPSLYYNYYYCKCCFLEKNCNEGMPRMDAVQYNHFSRAPTIITATIIIRNMEYSTKHYRYWAWQCSNNYYYCSCFITDVQRDEKIKAELLAYEKSKPSIDQPPQNESSNSDDDGMVVVAE